MMLGKNTITMNFKNIPKREYSIHSVNMYITSTVNKALC